MIKRTFVITVTILGFAGLYLAAGIYAGTEMPDVIKMENKAYKKHKKHIVEFYHKKHQDEYAKKSPEFFKNACGECHHDDNNKPLKNLKAGDDVKGCIECHKKSGEMPISEKKALKNKGLSKKEQLSKIREYHAEAIMKNCKDCHSKYNKKNKLSSKDKGYAPTVCIRCHSKK